MLPTKRIFDESAYITEFESEVLSCEKTEKGFEIILDSTAFFPEGGGQYPDKGTLNDVSVLDVQEDKDGVIRHLVPEEIPAGTKVSGKIRWEQRFDFMQQHSGEHIFSGIANKKFGANNVGFHLGYDETTIDLDVPLSEDQVFEIENENIFAN